MVDWEKFTGSEEQISEIDNAKQGYKLRYQTITNPGRAWESEILYHKLLLASNITQYLICQPNPHAEMIIEWAKTGRKVYQFDDTTCKKWRVVDYPNWHPNDKYSFNPAEEVSK
jgi:hypothetical protein